MADAEETLPGIAQSIQHEAEKTVRANTRIIWVIAAVQGVLIVFLSVVVVFLAYETLSEHKRVTSQILTTDQSLCIWNYDVATVTPAASTSKVGVTILVDSRKVVHTLGCRVLPPPSKELLQLAAKFHVSVPY